MSSDPATYVEDVPVKISEKFRPPRKIKLPASCNYLINMEALTDEYEFLVERETLQWLHNYKLHKDNKAKQRQDNIKKFEEAKAKKLEEELAKQKRIEEQQMILQAEEEERIKQLKRENEEKEEKEAINGVCENEQKSEKLMKSDEEKSEDEEKNESNSQIKSDYTTIDISGCNYESEIDCENKKYIDHNILNTVSSTKLVSNLHSVEKKEDYRYFVDPNNMTIAPNNEKTAMLSETSHHPSTMLVPTQFSPTPSNQRSPLKLNSKINFADFEGDASDPFDSVALKSINDMEELAKILQTSNLPDGKNDTNPKNLGADINYQLVGAYSNGAYNYNPYHSFLGYQQSNINSSAFNPISLYQSKEPTTSVPVMSNPNSLFHPVQSHMASHIQANHVSASGIKTSVPEMTSVSKRQDLEDFYRRYYSNQKHPVSGIRSEDNTPNQPNCRSLRSSNSVPDLTAVEDDEISSIVLCSKSSETTFKFPNNELPRPSSTGGIESKEKGYPDTRLMKMSLNSKSSLPDPFVELTSDAQTLVQSMAEMGFPRPRVARAVQKLGTDHKKLLEVLLALQAFQETGEDEYRSERAFYFFMGDIEKVNEFLAAAKTLLDLGFEEENVIEHLFKHQNDKDKCLEELIS